MHIRTYLHKAIFCNELRAMNLKIYKILKKFIAEEFKFKTYGTWKKNTIVKSVVNT